MNVLMISPGFPDEMPRFTRALAAVGARVIGLGDQPEGALLPEVREALTSDVLQVAGTGGAFAAVKADGSVVAWGEAAAAGTTG